MKIIDNTTPPDSVKFSDLEIGEVFIDPDIETPCMKVPPNILTTDKSYINNTLDLSDGMMYHCDDDDMVRRIRAELVISNL